MHVVVDHDTHACRDLILAFSNGPVCNAKGDPVQVLVSGGNPKWVYVMCVESMCVCVCIDVHVGHIHSIHVRSRE